MSPTKQRIAPVLKKSLRLPSAQQPAAAGAGSLTIAGSRSRPLWFDGRFLAAHDVEREQLLFLRRQAELGRAGGSGVVHGLLVDQGAAPGQTPDSETLVIYAGNGITPAGALVMIPADLTIRLSDLPDEENLAEQFGLAASPQQPQRTRTGVYIVALRPVQFTANPISSYPANLQNPRITRDGDVIEATAVSLIPFPNPVNQYDASLQQAALARQIFVGGSTVTVSNSVLPLAMIGVDRDEIQWVDCYLVRRDSGPQYSGVNAGPADPSVQQAFLLQYDAQLQAVVAANPNSGFQASDHFQALPPAGRFPLVCIDGTHFTQIYFPQQMSVQLSAIPVDELPAVIEESLTLPPIDLTLSAGSYSNLSLCALFPMPRTDFLSQQSSLPTTPLNPALPTVPVTPLPFQLLRLLQPPPTTAPPAPAGTWLAALQSQTYGFYALRRNQPVFVDFSTPIAVPTTTTTPAPTTTPGPTTTPS